MFSNSVIPCPYGVNIQINLDKNISTNLYNVKYKSWVKVLLKLQPVKCWDKISQYHIHEIESLFTEIFNTTIVQLKLGYIYTGTFYEDFKL